MPGPLDRGVPQKERSVSPAGRHPSVSRRLAIALLLLGVPASVQAGDAAAGQRVFNQCRACHTVEQGGRNGVGPNLWHVFGYHH